MSENKLMDAILKDGVQEVAALLKEPGVRVDCLDQTGMTPLQHAAFKGRADLCRLFLDHGADVNSSYHENSYSTLHFAALSGNMEVTRMILEAGAKVDHTNSVNRTASQMAAFVGQHQCVRAINNFFPRDQLERFTVPKGFEKEPKLPPHLVQPLLRLINFTNIHPVKIALYLKEHRELVLESYKVAKVLDIIVEESMKSRDTNDPLSIKCHYFASIIRHANKSLKNSEDTLDGFVKFLVKGREADGFTENQERLIRQALKEFPYVDSQLLQQLVRQIAPVKIGDSPTALSTLISGIYGPAFEDDNTCSTCGEAKAEKKCSACKCVTYCNQTCQKMHWPTHKKFCKKMAEEVKQALEEQLTAEEERKRREEEELAAKVKETGLTKNGCDAETNMPKSSEGGAPVISQEGMKTENASGDCTATSTSAETTAKEESKDETVRATVDISS